MLFVVLTTYCQYNEDVKGINNFSEGKHEMLENLDRATEDYFTVNFQCVGTGSGVVRRQGSYTNLCGMTENLQEGYYATYTFLPSSGSSLSHLYVNNVDKINELDLYDTGSGMSYSWTISYIHQNYTIVAVFNQAQYYSVDIQCLGSGSGTIRRQGSYTNLCGETDYIQEGYYATYTFLPSSGSTLSHLYVNNVDIVDNSLGYNEIGSGMSYSWSVSNIHQNYTITAVFSQAQYYSIDFQCVGTGSGTIRRQGSYTNLCGGSESIQEGYYATYTFLPSSGSSLSHLYVNNVDKIDELNHYETGSGMSYSWTVSNIRQNYTITAVFNQAQYYSVDFQCVGTGSGTIRRQGYYTNLCGETDYIQEGYYATYSFIPSSESVLSHLYVNNVDMINDLGYYDTGSGMSYSWSVSNMRQNYTITAVFNQAQYYSVGFQCVGTGSGTIRRPGYYTNLCGETDNLREGFYATYSFIPSSGSVLSHLYVNNVDMINDLGYYDNGSGMSYSWSVNNVQQDYAVRAVFNQIQYYSVDFQCLGSGSGTVRRQGSYTNLCGETDYVQEGYYATYLFMPNSVSVLSHLYVNNVDMINDLSYYDTGSGMSYSWSVNNANQDYMVTATFERMHTINVYSSNSNYGTAYGGGVYPHGTQISIYAEPYGGYTFAGWNDGVSDNPRNIIVMSDATYIANFEELPLYTITVLSSNNDYGTAEGGGTFYEGATVTIEAIPRQGYVFTAWNDGNRENPRTITVAGNATYIASFVDVSSEQTYYIRVVSSDEVFGTVTGGGVYAEGTIITIAAIPNPGYAFISWNDSNYENPRQVVVTRNETYIAIFNEEDSGEVGIDACESVRISLYPNPASDELNITSSESIFFIEIVNVMGQIVARMDVGGDSAVCDVSGLANGVYLVRIYDEHSATKGLAIQRKFIKE